MNALSDISEAPDVVSDPVCAVLGTLLHAGAWDALDIETVASRSAIRSEVAQLTVDRLVDELVVLICPFPGAVRYRLTSQGVTFAREMVDEVPAAWR